MRIVVVYESSYGNTHLIADAIGQGIADGNEVGTGNEVKVVPVAKASQELIEGADLVIVGGPTHVHGMSRERTRRAAAESAAEPGTGLVLDADAEGPGIREWFASLVPVIRTYAAAFDTHVDAPVVITGRASKGIRRRLRQHGFREIAEPMSFLVSKDSNLATGQQAVARQWGTRLTEILLDEVADAKAKVPPPTSSTTG
jgi:hypothetical protein